MACVGPRLPKGRGHISKLSSGLSTAVCPDRDLMKAFNKEECEHQRASLPFQVPSLSSFLPSPSMPSLALPSLRAAPSSPPGNPRATTGPGQSGAPPSKVQGSPLPPCPLQLVVLMGCASHRIPTQSLGLPGPAAPDMGGRGARTCLGP